MWIKRSLLRVLPKDIAGRCPLRPAQQEKTARGAQEIRQAKSRGAGGHGLQEVDKQARHLCPDARRAVNPATSQPGYPVILSPGLKNEPANKADCQIFHGPALGPGQLADESRHR